MAAANPTKRRANPFVVGAVAVSAFLAGLGVVASAQAQEVNVGASNLMDLAGAPQAAPAAATIPTAAPVVVVTDAPGYTVPAGAIPAPLNAVPPAPPQQAGTESFSPPPGFVDVIANPPPVAVTTANSTPATDAWAHDPAGMADYLRKLDQEDLARAQKAADAHVAKWKAQAEQASARADRAEQTAKAAEAQAAIDHDAAAKAQAAAAEAQAQVDADQTVIKSLTDTANSLDDTATDRAKSLAEKGSQMRGWFAAAAAELLLVFGAAVAFVRGRRRNKELAAQNQALLNENQLLRTQQAPRPTQAPTLSPTAAPIVNAAPPAGNPPTPPAGGVPPAGSPVNAAAWNDSMRSIWGDAWDLPSDTANASAPQINAATNARLVTPQELQQMDDAFISMRIANSAAATKKLSDAEKSIINSVVAATQKATVAYKDAPIDQLSARAQRDGVAGEIVEQASLQTSKNFPTKVFVRHGIVELGKDAMPRDIELAAQIIYNMHRQGMEHKIAANGQSVELNAACERVAQNIKLQDLSARTQTAEQMAQMIAAATGGLPVPNMQPVYALNSTTKSEGWSAALNTGANTTAAPAAAQPTAASGSVLTNEQILKIQSRVAAFHPANPKLGVEIATASTPSAMTVSASATTPKLPLFTLSPQGLAVHINNAHAIGVALDFATEIYGDKIPLVDTAPATVAAVNAYATSRSNNPAANWKGPNGETFDTISVVEAVTQAPTAQPVVPPADPVIVPPQQAGVQITNEGTANLPIEPDTLNRFFSGGPYLTKISDDATAYHVEERDGVGMVMTINTQGITLHTPTGHPDHGRDVGVAIRLATKMYGNSILIKDTTPEYAREIMETAVQIAQQGMLRDSKNKKIKASNLRITYEAAAPAATATPAPAAAAAPVTAPDAAAPKQPGRFMSAFRTFLQHAQV